jgi:hypothetical protein
MRSSLDMPGAASSRCYSTVSELSIALARSSRLRRRTRGENDGLNLGTFSDLGRDSQASSEAKTSFAQDDVQVTSDHQQANLKTQRGP